MATIEQHVKHIGAAIPTKRLNELRKRNPKFVSQKEGWRRYYKRDKTFDAVLELRSKLGFGGTFDKEEAARNQLRSFN